MTKIGSQTVLLGVLVLMAALSQTTLAHDGLDFSNFPAGASFTGRPSSPKLTTGLQRKFKTRIRQGAREGPDFAGHYKVVQWGCGSDCIDFVVVDSETGQTYDSPFPSLWLHFFEELDGRWEGNGLSYKLSSRLLIVDGCPVKTCGTYYYEWTGKTFDLILSVPLKPEISK